MVAAADLNARAGDRCTGRCRGGLVRPQEHLYGRLQRRLAGFRSHRRHGSCLDAQAALRPHASAIAAAFQSDRSFLITVPFPY